MNKPRPLVPDPCPESWDRLTPEERGHFCATCQTKVWDLSSMTHGEAQDLLRERAGEHLCVSYRERADGAVDYRSEAVVPVKSLMRRLPAAAGLSFVLAACTPTAGGDPPAADKPAASEPAPDSAKPEPEPEPDERRLVKGKWSDPVDPAPEQPAPERPIRKGKPKPDLDSSKPPPDADPLPKKGKVAPLEPAE